MTESRTEQIWFNSYPQVRPLKRPYFKWALKDLPTSAPRRAVCRLILAYQIGKNQNRISSQKFKICRSPQKPKQKAKTVINPSENEHARTHPLDILLVMKYIAPLLAVQGLYGKKTWLNISGSGNLTAHNADVYGILNSHFLWCPFLGIMSNGDQNPVNSGFD